MLNCITGVIVSHLLADSSLSAVVGSEVYPEEPNKNSVFPRVVVNVRQEGVVPGANAIQVSVVLTCYSASNRSDANDIHQLAKAVLYEKRLESTIDNKKYAGAIMLLSTVETDQDEILEKWYAESQWEGRFIQRS